MHPAYIVRIPASPTGTARAEALSPARMERLDGGSAVPSQLAGGIVALGNFDGFHLGHQAVVGRAVARARAASGATVEIGDLLVGVNRHRFAADCGYRPRWNERVGRAVGSTGIWGLVAAVRDASARECSKHCVFHNSESLARLRKREDRI